MVWDGIEASKHAHAAQLSPQTTASRETLGSSGSTALDHEPSLRGRQDENASAFITDDPTTQNTTAPSSEETTSEGQSTDGEVAEGEGGQGGAFNPVTGEINWDCPCLGGMAHGPCGPQFREAFSCFIFSEEEPKGIDCVQKFQAMQQCFREHPDVYGDGEWL